MNIPCKFYEKTILADKEYSGPEMCSCCQIDTAGNHEWNCPNNPHNIIDEKEE